jgi:hypothetical protein
MSQVRHLYIHPHLRFIALVQDTKHLLSVVCDLNGVEIDLLLSKLLDLFLYHTALGVTLRVIVTATVMVLFSMARCIGDENGVLALRLPVLFEGILKASRHILWQVSTSCGLQLFQELLASCNIIAKAKYL